MPRGGSRRALIRRRLPSYVASYVVRQGVTDDNPPSSELMGKVMSIGRGFQFLLTLPAEADAHYARPAASGAEDAPIIWYKPVGSSKYRVIRRDLSVKEVDDAPQVEGAVKLAR